jgi:hypothetical protein
MAAAGAGRTARGQGTAMQRGNCAQFAERQTEGENARTNAAAGHKKRGHAKASLEKETRKFG